MKTFVLIYHLFKFIVLIKAITIALNWHGFIAFVVSLFVSQIPIIGTIASMWGGCVCFNLNIISAILLFSILEILAIRIAFSR